MPCVSPPGLRRRRFLLCMLVQHAPCPRVALFWGQSSEVPLGFNPLISPTLKRQLASSAGGGSNEGSADSLRCSIAAASQNVTSGGVDRVECQ